METSKEGLMRSGGMMTNRSGFVSSGKGNYCITATHNCQVVMLPLCYQTKQCQKSGILWEISWVFFTCWELIKYFLNILQTNTSMAKQNMPVGWFGHQFIVSILDQLMDPESIEGNRPVKSESQRSWASWRGLDKGFHEIQGDCPLPACGQVFQQGQDWRQTDESFSLVKGSTKGTEVRRYKVQGRVHAQ